MERPNDVEMPAIDPLREEQRRCSFAGWTSSFAGPGKLAGAVLNVPATVERMRLESASEGFPSRAPAIVIGRSHR